MFEIDKSKVEIIIAAKDRTSAAFAKVNTQMKTMKGGTGRLTGAMNGLKGGLSKVSSSLGSFGAALGPVGIAVAAVSAVVVTLGGAAFKAALEFEKAFATIRAGTGATGEALKGFEDDFRAIYVAIPSNAAAISKALSNMTNVIGASGTVLQDLTKNVMEASRMLGEDGAANALSFGKAMNQWQIPAESGVALMEQFFKISQDTNIGFGELTGAMNAYGPVLQNAGFIASESAELFGRLEGSGIAVSRVMPGLNSAFRKWAEEGKNGKESLEATIEAILNAKTNMEALTIATDIFGAEGAQRMTTAVRNGTFELSSLGEMLEGTEGIIMKTSEATLQFGEKWAILKNKVTAAIEPMGAAILNVLGRAMDGAGDAFEKLQKIAGPAMDIILIKAKILHAFFSALFKPLIDVLGPLKKRLSETSGAFENLKKVLVIVSDVATILIEGARLLGSALGTLLAKAITPLVDKVEEAIEMLTEFYNKLGPIKTLLEGAKGVFGKAAERVHDFASALKDTEKTAEEVKEAIEEVGEASEEMGKTATEAVRPIIEETKEAIEKQKEFTVTIGDTTIEFKDATAEVIKNADAYEELQESAQKIMDLEWSVFTEFEASLPNIEAGIGDMESAFVGLKGVLEDNVDELENVKQSVIDISEIAAPFLEAGFLKGIEAIGSFAGALKDANSAINTFSSLQDISIDGCINFSAHVRDMVWALEILEEQMDDLVPSFGEMDSLIGGIMESFVWVPGKKDSLAEEINRIADAAKDGSGSFSELSKILQETTKFTISGFRGEFSGPYLERYKKGVEDIKDITSDFLASEEVLERQVGYTTDALTFQTTQLSKITDALQPYLEFMRTLNELAALTTLSTDELNNGLNAINDTLFNLGKALTSFDLRGVMESLFAPETGGALGFMDVMKDFDVDFGLFATTLTRVTEVIQNLSIAMENAAGMVVISSEDMVDAMALIPEQLMEISEFLMSDLWSTIVTSIEIINREWQVFEETLGGTGFTKVISTISNLIDLMGSVKNAFKDTSEQVVISSEDMGAAVEKIPEQLMEISEFLMSDLWTAIATSIGIVDREWQVLGASIEESMPSFISAVDVFSTLTSKILTLSASLDELKGMTVLSVRDIDEAMKKIPLFLDGFVDALRLNMYGITESLKDLDKEWQKYADDMIDALPSFEASASTISKLVRSLLSLHSALVSLSEMGTISSTLFDTGFSALINSISNFAVSLSKNVDALISSLQKLSAVWIENEAVLLPLMRDFSIISDNLWGVAHNANRMGAEFENLNENSETLEEGFKSLMGFINQVVKSTKEFYTPEAAAELADFNTDVGKVIDSFADLEHDLGDVMGKIRNAIGSAVGDIERKISGLSNLVKDAYYWGANMMMGFINGIYYMFDDLELAMMRMVGLIAKYLGVYSNTEKGPLSHLEDWGPNLVKTYTAGIKGEMGTLNASFAGFAPSIAAGVGGSSTNNVNLYISQTITDRDTADYANQNLERLMHKHSVM